MEDKKEKFAVSLEEHLETAEYIFIKVDENAGKTFPLLVEKEFWLVGFSMQDSMYALWVRNSFAFPQREKLIQDTVKATLELLGLLPKKKKTKKKEPVI